MTEEGRKEKERGQEHTQWGEVAPVRHSLNPEGLSSFDLHVLSMPPAFILSQNQTLKFNCLKSLLFSSNGSNYFLLSLC